MSAKEMKLATKIAQILSHFPEQWQNYQDWLRDISGSQPELQLRHAKWQAMLIFRWRLAYFVIYVGSIIIFHQLQCMLNGRATVVSPQVENEETSISSTHAVLVLQRTSTLIAVAILTLCGVAALSGILLAFNYEPTTIGAHLSLTKIVTQVPNGALILSLHNIAGNGLIALSLIQIIVLFLSRQFQSPWFKAWVSGIFLTLSAMGLSWTAIALNWDQLGFWRLKMELSIIQSIPFVGSEIRAVLAGGEGIGSLTLQHVYTLHSYVLTIAAIGLSISHLVALIMQEHTWQNKENSFSSIQGERNSIKHETPSVSS